ncbi:MAG: hypothetical protein GY722_11270 [bacterium]|nr:hypothetical protein [bacterium]
MTNQKLVISATVAAGVWITLPMRAVYLIRVAAGLAPAFCIAGVDDELRHISPHPCTDGDNVDE